MSEMTEGKLYSKPKFTKRIHKWFELYEGFIFTYPAYGFPLMMISMVIAVLSIVGIGYGIAYLYNHLPIILIITIAALILWWIISLVKKFKKYKKERNEGNNW